YSLGQTPNPCALCNAKVKLAVPFCLLAPDEFLVTGHYAKYHNGLLCRGSDSSKDQSYFLSLVPKAILDRCYFPLADSVKTDVRAEVIENDLPFIASESQDLCFNRGKVGVPGDIVNCEGMVIGRHNGLEGYTPGQRKGLGAHGTRKFVVELDTYRNTLVIGDEKNLYSSSCFLNNINWLAVPQAQRMKCLVQTRYRKPAVEADLLLSNDGLSAEVRFQSPQKAVAPGQVGAIFLSDRVLGGGI
ncbi:MAG: tRNA 2-thiouridine(34) synthase MnmA, partial [bacterium]|nr:tRNA 2-thiouridine(34) synthase MnmA [bacterium]